jgi:hypothetical protein
MMKTSALAGDRSATGANDVASHLAGAASRRTGPQPGQNEANFRRRDRSPNDPPVVANRRFHGIKLKS